MGDAKRRRDGLRWFQPEPEDLHVCPRCRTLYGVCADCRCFWEAYPPGWKHDPVGAEPCDNCAFAKGSPESLDRDGWRDLLAKLRAGGLFNCHKGAPILIDDAAGTIEFDEGWVRVHGRTCAGFLRAMQQWPDWMRRRYPDLVTEAPDAP